MLGDQKELLVPLWGTQERMSLCCSSGMSYNSRKLETTQVAMDGWMVDEGMMDGWIDGWIDEWMDGWMDGRVDGSMDD